MQHLLHDGLHLLLQLGERALPLLLQLLKTHASRAAAAAAAATSRVTSSSCSTGSNFMVNSSSCTMTVEQQGNNQHCHAFAAHESRVTLHTHVTCHPYLLLSNKFAPL